MSYQPTIADDVVLCTDCGGLVANELRDVHTKVCPAGVPPTPPELAHRPPVVYQAPDGSWPERPDTDEPVFWQLRSPLDGPISTPPIGGKHGRTGDLVGTDYYLATAGT